MQLGSCEHFSRDRQATLAKDVCGALRKIEPPILLGLGTPVPQATLEAIGRQQLVHPWHWVFSRPYRRFTGSKWSRQQRIWEKLLDGLSFATQVLLQLRCGDISSDVFRPANEDQLLSLALRQDLLSERHQGTKYPRHVANIEAENPPHIVHAHAPVNFPKHSNGNLRNGQVLQINDHIDAFNFPRDCHVRQEILHGKDKNSDDQVVPPLSVPCGRNSGSPKHQHWPKSLVPSCEIHQTKSQILRHVHIRKGPSEVGAAPLCGCLHHLQCLLRIAMGVTQVPCR
mmetsp:Transcript_49348/g.107472  ORF Transcript_49348/g.107472 Transcript_49348/m.107472 type:complete len:284 (+) Transcript_49348:282-1133(+)